MQQYIDLTIDFANRNDRINGITLDRVTTRSYDTAIKFRIEIIGHTLDDTYDVKILTKYHKSGLNVMTALGDSLEVVEGKLIYTPKVNLITEADYVRNYLYLSKDGLGLDMAQFNYQVDVSQIGEAIVEVRQVYDESYESLIAEFEQALEDYKLTLPQADSVRAEIDVILNRFGVDSQQVIGDLVEVTATAEVAEEARKEAETLREDNYEQLIDTAIVEADVVAKVDNKVTELTPQISNLTAQLAQMPKQTLNPKGRKSTSLITFITDDANGADLTTFKPIFDRQGVKFNTCAVAQRTISGGGLSIAQLKALQDEGHEILSHGYNHLYMSTLTDSEIDYEMRMSKEYFNNNGLKVESIAIPYGDFDERVLLSAQKYYRSARVSLGVINEQPIATHELRTTWIETSTAISPVTGFARNSLDHYKKMIDIATENDNWLIISTHSWEIAQWGYESLLEDIVVYAKTKAEIVTVSEALDQIGNVLETSLHSQSSFYEDHFALSSDGKVSSNLGFMKAIRRNSIDLHTPIESFENFRVSQCVLISPTISGLPENRSGILSTFKFVTPLSADMGYSYQTFKPYGTSRFYIRTVLADGTWEEFYNPYDEKRQLSYSVERYSITADMLPSDFPKGKKIYSIFKANQAGMPFTNAGTIEVDFIGVFGENYGYGKQIVKSFNGTKIYIRSAQSATTWSDWTEISL